MLSLTFSTFGIEVILHILCMIFTENKSTEIKIVGHSDGCLRAFNVISALYFYGLLSGWLLALVFLKPESAYRQELFEVLQILVCFAAVQIVKLVPVFFEERILKRTDSTIERPENEEKLLLIYQFVLCLISYICFVITVITAVVFAIKALQTNIDGTHVVTDIDRVAYGFAIFFGIMTLLGSIVTGILLRCCTPTFVKNVMPSHFH